jgi:hypothetical protein
VYCLRQTLQPQKKTAEFYYGDEVMLPLHFAITRKRSLDLVNALLEAYPEAVKAEMTKWGLPLRLSLEFGASDDVVLAVLAAYTDAARDTGSKDSSMLPLHIAIIKKRSLDVIKALFDAFPKAAEARLYWGELPLSLALRLEVSDDVVLALLAAYPVAAKDTGSIDRPLMLPLHSALEKKRSLDVVKALLDVYPKGVEAKYKNLQLLNYALLTVGASDDVVLALLAAYPEAAKDTGSIDFEMSILPLHAAILRKRSQRVVEALLDAYPGAEKENNLLLHEFLDLEGNPNAEDVQALIDKYHDAVRKVGKNGMLPLHTALFNGASDEVIRVLLMADPSAAETKAKCSAETKAKCLKGKGYNHANEDEGVYEDILPLHAAIIEKRSLDIVKALLDLYPKAAEVRLWGLLPLSISFV